MVTQVEKIRTVRSQSTCFFSALLNVRAATRAFRANLRIDLDYPDGSNGMLMQVNRSLSDAARKTSDNKTTDNAKLPRFRFWVALPAASVFWRAARQVPAGAASRSRDSACGPSQRR